MSDRKPTVLAFSVNEKQEPMIKLICMKRGFGYQKIAPVSFAEPIASLAGDEELLGNVYEGEEFPEGMLLFVRMDDRLVNTFLTDCRAMRFSRPTLLAIQTETNSSWTPIELYEQLSAERQSIREKMKSIHEAEGGHAHHHGKH